jgi:protein-L-isoaspartate O-methyltransferase
MGASVVTVERDARLAAEARERLTDLGYGDVTVESVMAAGLAGDGALRSPGPPPPGKHWNPAG